MVKITVELRWELRWNQSGWNYGHISPVQSVQSRVMPPGGSHQSVSQSVSPGSCLPAGHISPVSQSNPVQGHASRRVTSFQSVSPGSCLPVLCNYGGITVEITVELITVELREAGLAGCRLFFRCCRKFYLAAKEKPAANPRPRPAKRSPQQGWPRNKVSCIWRARPASRKEKPVANGPARPRERKSP